MRVQSITKLLSVFSLIFCLSYAFGSVTTKATKPKLNVYVVGSFNGIMPFLAEGIYTATKAFVEQTNASGGLLGRKLEIHRLDDQADLAKAAINAEIPLRDPNHLFTIGHPFSSIALPIGKLYAKREKLFLTPYATSAEISKIGGSVFQLCFNDAFQGKILASVAINRLRGKHILVMRNISDPYSDGLAQTFLTETRKLVTHSKASTEEFRYIFDRLDFELLAKVIQESNPDIIFLPELKVRAAEILRRLASKGIELPKLLGADGWGSEDGTLDIFFSGESESKNSGYFFTYHWHPDITSNVNRKIKELLSKETGKRPYGPAVLTFESLLHLKRLIELHKTIDNVVLSNKLRGSSFEGTTGTIKFEENGETARNLVLIELTKSGLKLDSLVGPPR